MPTTDPVGASEDELKEYRGIIVREIRSHRLFSRITLLTGVGLLVLGGTIAYSSLDFAPLGYLLLIAGGIRFLNTFYDLQREDSLKKSLKAVEQKFGKREPET